MSDSGAEQHGSSAWWKIVALCVITITIAATAAGVFIGAFTEGEDGPKLTHTITRGDLIVTVTEQGTLESSNNTEIKCQVRGFNTVTWVVPGGTVVKPGDELVRLDTKVIEETVSLQKTNAHMAKATLERSKANVAKAQIAIDAYLDGEYRQQMQSLRKQAIIAESNLRTAEKMLKQSKLLFKRGYVTKLEVEGNAFTVRQAQLELDVRNTEIEVLNKYIKEMRLERLKGTLTASKSKLQADVAGLEMTESRRDRAEKELKACVVRAKHAGLVIYPSAAKWKNVPDIAEGVTVRKDQILLLMPDLTKMQIKVGVHESIVDRVKVGQVAQVSLPDKTLEAKVNRVANVTRPAGWWTGNVVKYDTIIKLPSVEGLKPGMSAEVQIILAEHRNVLTVPVAAVVEVGEKSLCWVKTNDGTVERRELDLGDSNEAFSVVKSGLSEGDQVVLNPQSYVEDAKEQMIKSLDGDEHYESLPETDQSKETASRSASNSNM